MIAASVLFRALGRRQVELVLADGRRLTSLPLRSVYVLGAPVVSP